MGTPTSLTTSSDELLRQALIGNWSNEYERLSFQADGTYEDTSITVAQFGTEPKDTMIEVKSGAYSVENGVVDYSNVRFAYRTASGKPWPGFGDASLPQLMHLISDSLRLTPTDILTRVTSAQSATLIYGTWRSLEWRLMLRADSLDPKWESRLEILHTFAKDSASYSETWHYLDLPQLPVATYHGTYQYSPPNLQICKGDTTLVHVTFASSRMYWLHDDWSRMLVRIK